MGGAFPRQPVVRRRDALCALLIALASMLAVPAAIAKPGRIDRSFGRDGIARTELGPHYVQTQFISVAPQADGRLLATRDTRYGLGALIRRYEPNGSLDPSFAPQSPAPQTEAVQEDGKVLVAKQGWPGPRLERLNPDGTTDTTFGGDGKSDTVPFAIKKIALFPSGKIIVAGREFRQTGKHSAISQISVARFESDGKLDSGFGAAGVVKLLSDYSLAADILRGLAPQEGEGALVVADSRFSWPGEVGSFVARLTVAGTLDPGYGAAGAVRLNTSITAFRALADGKLLLAGSRWGARVGCCAFHESDFLLARYTAAGRPDPTFGGGDGSAIADFGGIDLANAVQREGDGSVLIGGSTTATTGACLHFGACRETPALARFTPDGRFDPGFGTGGLLRLDALVGSAPTVRGRGALALSGRPGGGVFAAGGAGFAAFIAALGPTGALDPSFGSAGIVTEREPSPSTQTVNAVAIDRHRRILVASRTNAGSTSIVPRGAVIRYRPNGALDRSFGDGAGYVRVPAGAGAIAVDRAGRSIVHPDRWGEGAGPITRITAAGEIDASFGEEGTVRLDSLMSIAALPNGRILAATCRTRHGSRMVVVVRLRPNGRLDRSFGRKGKAILGFGRGRGCGVNKLAVQPDGHILLAGDVGRSKRSPRREGRTLALMRLLPNGAPDRSFGRGGQVTPRVGRNSVATGVATQGGKILVAGWKRRSGRTTALLLRYTRHGHLDRSFARRGIARTVVGPSGKHAIPREVITVLPTRRRIVLVRTGLGRPVLAYRRNGRLDRSFARGRGIAPNRFIAPFLPPGPVGALQRGKVVLAWEAAKEAKVALQRLTNR